MTIDRVVQLPAPALRGCIAHYAGFRAGAMPGAATQTGLPSRHAHLIISLNGPIDILAMPDPRQRPGKFRALVCGLQDAPALLSGTQAGIDMLHLFLTPLGVHALLGVPCAALANRVVELADLWGSATALLLERLFAAPSWQQRFAVLDETFLRRMQAVTVRAEIMWAWQRLTRAHGAVPIQQVARELGWSRRHFSEQFCNAVGLTPKTAARIFRFEHACRVLMDEGPALVDVAARCGFQDQAHMTREWHALGGTTPRAWIAKELPFLQDYELAGGDDVRTGAVPASMR